MTPPALLPVEEARARVLALASPAARRVGPPGGRPRARAGRGRAAPSGRCRPGTTRPWMATRCAARTSRARCPSGSTVGETIYAGADAPGRAAPGHVRAHHDGRAAARGRGRGGDAGADAAGARRRGSRWRSSRRWRRGPLRAARGARTRGRASCCWRGARRWASRSWGCSWAQGLHHGRRCPARPRVAILSTGDELCRADEPPEGRIVDTNAPALALAVRRAGRHAHAAGHRPGHAGGRATRACAGGPGLRRGAHQRRRLRGRARLREATRWQKLGVEMDFWRVAIKPGKPLAVGRRGAHRSTSGCRATPPPRSSPSSCSSARRCAGCWGTRRWSPPGCPAGWRASCRKPPGLAHYVRVTASLARGRALGPSAGHADVGCSAFGGGGHPPARTSPGRPAA